MSVPNKRKLFVLLLVVMACILFTYIFFWQRKDPNKEQKVFYQALRQSMTQPGLACTITDSSDNTKSRQIIELDLESKTDLRSTLSISPDTSTSIETEEISTSSGNYLRYTSIHTSQKDAAGNTPSLGNKDVLEVWSKVSAVSGSPTLFSKTVLGNCVVPLADLDTNIANNLVDDSMYNDVFRAVYAKSSIIKQGNTEIRVYDVSIQPTKYINFMKKVAKAYGLKDLNSVNPDDFAKKTAEPMKFYIETKTNMLQKISYSKRDHDITFTRYGIKPAISAPKTYISAQELQQRLHTE